MSSAQRAKLSRRVGSTRPRRTSAVSTSATLSGMTLGRLGPWRDIVERIHCGTAQSQLEVQVRPRRGARRADASDPDARFDPLALCHRDAAEVGVDGRDSMAVVDDDRSPVCRKGAGGSDGAGPSSEDRGSPLPVAIDEIHTGVRQPPSACRVVATAEHRAGHRISQGHAQLTEDRHAHWIAALQDRNDGGEPVVIGQRASTTRPRYGADGSAGSGKQACKCGLHGGMSTGTSTAWPVPPAPNETLTSAMIAPAMTRRIRLPIDRARFAGSFTKRLPSSGRAKRGISLFAPRTPVFRC